MWQQILASEKGGFCEVPVALMQRLRKDGSAQMAEIVELREQLAKLPDVEEEVAQMEAQLEELEATCLVNANEPLGVRLRVSKGV